VLFIVTAVRTSNPTILIAFVLYFSFTCPDYCQVVAEQRESEVKLNSTEFQALQNTTNDFFIHGMTKGGRGEGTW
jgi:hypothetical protein